MEKKYFLFGILSLILAMVLITRQERNLRQAVLPQPTQEALIVPAVEAKESVREDVPSVQKVAQLWTLANGYVAVSLNELGGGIHEVALKKYARSLVSSEPWKFNENASKNALNLRLVWSDGREQNLANLDFEVRSKSDSHLLLRAPIEGGYLEREYDLPRAGEDPYLIHQTVRIVIDGESEEAFPTSCWASLGSLPPTEGDVNGDHLNFVRYDGRKARFVRPAEFKASNGFFSIGRRSARSIIGERGRIVWGAVKNQFFTSILIPAVPARAFQTQTTMVNDDKGELEEGMGGALLLPLQRSSAGAFEQKMDLYVGPKEYARLDRLGQRQDLVMQFGFFGFISKLLLLLMMAIHRLVQNWGWTIILLTVFIKTLLWPLTSAQVRSTRGMSKLQQPLKEIQAKYKNNPKKVQAETLKLFRENRVNPAAGCLPIFFQIPIFLGLYFMLRTASELRFADFFWIRDLSVADTVGYCCGFPVNPLPLVMGLTMFWQMKMTPTTTQNTTQRRIFQLMPLLFLCFCYRFPSGLVLYWTVQNLLTIIQQWVLNRRLAQEEAVRMPKQPQKRSKKNRKI